MKRTTKSNSNSSSKKTKVEKPCYFPFGIQNVADEIIKYLEGRHLMNFKLACKASNEATKGKSCTIEITRRTFDRTTSTPGCHLIKCDGVDAIEIESYLMSFLSRSYPEIKHLTFDYCGDDTLPPIYQPFINRLESLHTLRIIRCRGDVELKVYGLSSLEIYTSGCIDLTIKKPIGKALLHSTEDFINRANIVIRISREIPIKSISEFKCNAHVTALSYGNARYGIIDHTFETFVPNPKLL